MWAEGSPGVIAGSRVCAKDHPDLSRVVPLFSEHRVVLGAPMKQHADAQERVGARRQESHAGHALCLFGVCVAFYAVFFVDWMMVFACTRWRLRR